MFPRQVSQQIESRQQQQQQKRRNQWQRIEYRIMTSKSSSVKNNFKITHTAASGL